MAHHERRTRTQTRPRPQHRQLRRSRLRAVPAPIVRQVDGLFAGDAGSAGGRHRRYRLGLQQLPPHRPRTDRGGEARRAGRRRAAAGVPDRVAVRAVAVPDLDALPQPRRARHRGDADRAADGCRGAGGRLRQDGAGAIDGGGLGRHSGGATGHRPDAGDAVPGRAAVRLHRLPPVLGRRIAPGASPPNASARSRAGWPPPPAPAA